MSTEAVELVKRVWEAWDRRDTDSVFALYADDVEWTMYPGLTGIGEDVVTYHGKEGVRRYHRQMLEVWGDYSARAEFSEDLGDAVLVRVKASGVGKLGAVPVDMTIWHLWKVRDGKVVSVRGYPTEAKAREEGARRDPGGADVA